MDSELPSFSRKELQSAGLNLAAAQVNKFRVDKRRKSCFEENVKILKSLEIIVPKGFKVTIKSNKKAKTPVKTEVKLPKKKVVKKEAPVKVVKEIQKEPKKVISTPTIEIPTMKHKKAEIIEYILSQKISKESEDSLTKLKKADLLKLL